MQDDLNREDIRQTIEGKIAESSILGGYTEDFGITSSVYPIAFKIDEAINTFGSMLTEFYRPNSELHLLSRLMYEIGYLRLQSPLRVQVEMKSEYEQEVEQYSRFTNGQTVFMADEYTVLEKDTPQTITLTLGSRRVIAAEVDQSVMYFKIPLSTTYKKMYDFSIKVNGEAVEYSQQFISLSSDASLEILPNGELQVVIRLGNTNGKNVSLNDTLEIEIFETTASDTVPVNMSKIGALHTVCENITKYESYDGYMTIPEMQEIILYNKNINNSLVYNEDFRGHILAHVPNIEAIKVWQQEEEDLQNGTSECNINKIFCSYIPTDGGGKRDAEIEKLISVSIDGRFVYIRDPEINQVQIEINITNNTKKFIPDTMKQQVIDSLVGYYDGKMSLLTDNKVYKTCVSILDDFDLDIDISIQNKISLRNELFYYVASNKVNISVEERG